jgi:3-deoxy-D-manno-octulosonic-acid transferase
LAKDEAFIGLYKHKHLELLSLLITSRGTKLNKTTSQKKVLFSEKGENLADFDVFIIDTIGILTKIYSYADIAFVGGGLGILAFITY